MKPAGRGRVYGGMTETLQDRLRHGAKNIHSIGPDRAAGLLAEAATRLEQSTMAENCIAFPVAKEVAEARANTETLRKMLIEARGLVDAGLAARRAFLERAVCHPGPPLSETEGYDPDAPVGELEAAILERLDHETEDRRDLWDIRKRCEEALGRTPDPARKTMQVVLDLCAYAEAARTYRANMEDPPADLEAHERAFGWPVVRPEHFAGPFPALSGYVKRTRKARAATIDQALRMLKPGQSLAVHDEPERVDILFLDPGQCPPLGQTWTVYTMSPDATLGSLRTIGGTPAGGEMACATGSELRQDAIAEHIRAHGGDPAAATVAQIADALNAVDPNATYKPNAAGNGLDWSPVHRAGVGGTIRIVDGDPGALASLGLPLRPAVAAHMATLRANSADRSPGPRLRRTMAEASAEHEGDAVTRQMYRPMMETRRRQTYRPGSPIPERAPADYHPAEYMTPEQEAEAVEQAERFQGLDDSDRD